MLPFCPSMKWQHCKQSFVCSFLFKKLFIHKHQAANWQLERSYWLKFNSHSCSHSKTTTDVINVS